MANFNIEKEVSLSKDGGSKLCFQFGKYNYDDGGSGYGYRFIWRYPNGNLQPARGQACIPSIADMLELLSMAFREGWNLH